MEKTFPPNVGIYQSMCRRNTNTSVSNQLSDVPAMLVIVHQRLSAGRAWLTLCPAHRPVHFLLRNVVLRVKEHTVSHDSPGVHESMNDLYVADGI